MTPWRRSTSGALDGRFGPFVAPRVAPAQGHPVAAPAPAGPGGMGRQYPGAGGALGAAAVGGGLSPGTPGAPCRSPRPAPSPSSAVPRTRYSPCRRAGRCAAVRPGYTPRAGDDRPGVLELDLERGARARGRARAHHRARLRRADGDGRLGTADPAAAARSHLPAVRGAVPAAGAVPGLLLRPGVLVAAAVSTCAPSPTTPPTSPSP